VNFLHQFNSILNVALNWSDGKKWNGQWIKQLILLVVSLNFVRYRTQAKTKSEVSWSGGHQREDEERVV
jgi:hypothetical protein